MKSTKPRPSRLSRFFGRTFRREEDQRAREIVESLRQTPVFADMSSRTLETLADFVHIRDYRPHEYIYYDNDPGLGLYIVASGRIALLIEDTDGTATEIRRAGPGELIGELSVLAGFRRMETAQAVEETRLFGLFRPDFNSLIKRHPRSGSEILQMFTRYLSTRQAALIGEFERLHGRVNVARVMEKAASAENAISDDRVPTYHG